MYLNLCTRIIVIYIFSVHTSQSDGCGTVISGPRIVGGEDTGGYHYPWFALLRLRTTGDPPVCAGSLIAPSYVLTAAHCFSSFPGKPKESLFTVALGVYNRCSSSEATRRIFSVVHVDVHEGYSPENKFYDIALMKLEQPSDFPVVCLPSPSAAIISEPGLLVGFGVTKQGNRVLPCRQRQAKVTKYSSKQCADTKLPAEDSHEPTVFCAGGQGIDSCQGDSGGPFLTQNRERNFVVAGIVSYGYGCAKPGLPGIYTNVASYLDWIQTKIANQENRNGLKPTDKKSFFDYSGTFHQTKSIGNVQILNLTGIFPFSVSSNKPNTPSSIFPTSPPGSVFPNQHYGTIGTLNFAEVSPFLISKNQFFTTPSSIFPTSQSARVFPSQNLAQNAVYNQNKPFGSIGINLAGGSPFFVSRNQFSTTPSLIFPTSSPASIFPS